jgi:hypothetical protein
VSERLTASNKKRVPSKGGVKPQAKKKTGKRLVMSE